MRLWRKCVLGPETSVGCLSCQRKVGVPWGAVMAAVPLALGIFGSVRLSAPWSIASLVAAILAYIALQHFFVPVVGRDA
jgi:hypothetical protein